MISTSSTVSQKKGSLLSSINRNTFVLNFTQCILLKILVILSSSCHGSGVVGFRRVAKLFNLSSLVMALVISRSLLIKCLLSTVDTNEEMIMINVFIIKIIHFKNKKVFMKEKRDSILYF